MYMQKLYERLFGDSGLMGDVRNWVWNFDKSSFSNCVLKNEGVYRKKSIVNVKVHISKSF